MLQKLHIRNYAIIDDLQVNFTRGLNIITGETGAGKSILMGALNLVLGSRADAAIMPANGAKLMVEAGLQLKPSPEVTAFFKDHDLDLDEEIILRREITATGKSRAFINDSPVNLGQLRRLGLMLVDLHQQFDTLDLASQHFQTDVLDAMGGNIPTLQQYRKEYQSYAAAHKQYLDLQARQLQLQKEEDYNQHLFDELEALALKENEIEETEETLKLMSHAEKIKAELSQVCGMLSENDRPITNQLKVVINQLKALEEFHPGLAELSVRLRSAGIELEDIAAELYQENEKIVHDQQKLEALQEKLSPVYKMLKKHGVQTTAELLGIKSSLQEKLDQSLNIQEETQRMKLKQEAVFEACQILAEKLSANRKKAIPGLLSSVHELLKKVGMPGARLDVEMNKGDLTATGYDSVRFLFDANKTGRLEPLHKVASGGELSRLMLSIKSLVAQKLELPTLIFDEIDTGISGEAARQAGIIMKELSDRHQTIAITHQPQIAARATSHLMVYKEKINDKMVTAIIHLENDDRVLAIAKMLSGEKPTAAALQNAREMVNN